MPANGVKTGSPGVGETGSFGPIRPRLAQRLAQPRPRHGLEPGGCHEPFRDGRGSALPPSLTRSAPSTFASLARIIAGRRLGATGSTPRHEAQRSTRLAPLGLAAARLSQRPSLERNSRSPRH
jgi:hypothetical protein